MSAYHYYEFQAVDTPLDEQDRKALARMSRSAEITSTKLASEHYWGDFRGNPRALMERWFDLHLHVAKWGRRMMIRLPARLAGRALLEEFSSAIEEVELLDAGDNLIVDIEFDTERSDWDFDSSDGAGRLDSIAPLRYDILAGDFRAFYILWLTVLERGQVGDGCNEPLPGIGPLSPPLESFAEFFGVDRDLLRAAAERPAQPGGGAPADVPVKAMESIPDAQKAELLVRLADGDPHAVAAIRNRIRIALVAADGRCRHRRTVSELRERGLGVREERLAEEARLREAERLRKAAEADRAQRARIDSIRRREEEAVWNEVEGEIEFKHATSYDRAVKTLGDLQRLATETGRADSFVRRIASIRERHGTKQKFIERLDKHRIGLD